MYVSVGGGRGAGPQTVTHQEDPSTEGATDSQNIEERGRGIHAGAFVCSDAYTYTSMHIYVYMSVCVCACAYIHLYMYMHSCTHMYVHVYI